MPHVCLVDDFGTRRALDGWMDNAQDGALDHAQNLIISRSYGEAAEAFRALYDQRPEDPEILVALAEAMAQIGQPEASLALLADSVDESAPDQATLLRIAEDLKKVGRLEESADFLICALACAPEDASLRSTTESALEALGRAEQLEWLKSGAAGEMPSA